MINRKFGVEIEFGIDQDAARELTKKKKRTCSCTERYLNYYGCGCDESYDIESVLQRASKQERAPISKKWHESLHEDGSEWEICSPILEGPPGYAELARVMSLLKRHGGYVTNSDGLHVHHDAPDYVRDPEAIVKLVKSWYVNSEWMRMFVNSDRAYESTEGSWSPCPAWDEHSVTDLAERAREGVLSAARGYDLDHERRDLNIRSLAEHGTIEIRLHEGTLDFKKARAWIRMGQALLNSVAKMKTPLAEAESREELLQRLGVRSVWRQELLAAR